MAKVLSLRFQQCFGPFIMYLVEESSESGLFRHLSNHAFWSCKFKNISAMRVIFFWKIFKIESKFRKCKKILESKFLF